MHCGGNELGNVGGEELVCTFSWDRGHGVIGVVKYLARIGQASRCNIIVT